MSKTARKDFNSFNWREIARLLGATLKRHDKAAKQVHLYMFGAGTGDIIISDNGGEVNISEIRPLVSQSVPYTSNLFDVGEMTLADRIFKTIKGHKIDWKRNVDKMGASDRRARWIQLATERPSLRPIIVPLLRSSR